MLTSLDIHVNKAVLAILPGLSFSATRCFNNSGKNIFETTNEGAFESLQIHAPRLPSRRPKPDQTQQSPTQHTVFVLILRQISRFCGTSLYARFHSAHTGAACELPMKNCGNYGSLSGTDKGSKTELDFVASRGRHVKMYELAKPLKYRQVWLPGTGRVLTLQRRKRLGEAPSTWNRKPRAQS